MSEGAPAVGIIMGSKSDWSTLRHAADTLDALSVPYETRIVSAHRTPQRLVDYASSARDRGLKVIIAGAGGAAHLPGMTASLTPLPVFGVPVESKALKGMDSLLSIVQMPGGVPVGTLAIGRAGAINAALLAAAVLALSDAGSQPRWTIGAHGRRHRWLKPPATRTDRGCHLSSTDRWLRARLSGSWAAASLAACPPWRRPGWAIVATSIARSPKRPRLK